MFCQEKGSGGNNLLSLAIHPSHYHQSRKPTLQYVILYFSKAVNHASTSNLLITKHLFPLHTACCIEQHSPYV